MRAQLELNTSAPQTVLNNPYQAIVCLEGQLIIIHRTCVALVLSFCSVWLLFLIFCDLPRTSWFDFGVAAEALRFEGITSNERRMARRFRRCNRHCIRNFHCADDESPRGQTDRSTAHRSRRRFAREFGRRLLVAQAPGMRMNWSLVL